MALVALLTATALSLRGSMHDALAASNLLVNIAEARVIRINLAPEGGATEPPAEFGTVFAFEGYSWFYAAERGNRILGPSLPPPLTPPILVERLRKVGIPAEQVVIYAHSPAPTNVPGQVTIPNACVIGSLVALEQRLLSNESVQEAGLVLLSYGVSDADKAPTLLVDHCVLVFRNRKGWQCVDPRKTDESQPLERLQIGAPVDSALMGVALQSRYPLKSARLLPIPSSTLEQITTTALWRAQHNTLEAPL